MRPTVVVHPADSAYPARLAEVRDAPRHLYICGELPARRFTAAIVGARAASGHGMAMAEELARELTLAGGLVVSGGAIGIDSSAHRGALAAGGPTAAVLACGVDVVYPLRHRQLYDRMLAAGGALLSPYEPGVPPRRFHFVRRNRVIAALADVVIVVEAQAASGSLYTAVAATEYGRVLAAVPGTPGCEALIAQGAALVKGGDDVLAALAGMPRRPDVSLPEPGSAMAKVLGALDVDAPRDLVGLQLHTGLASRELTRALTGLELEGLAVLLPGQAYLRSAVARDLLRAGGL